jgi:hypothetical protein
MLLRKIAWPLLLFVVAWVLGAFFGIPLKRVIAPIYNLLPGLAWLIIALGVVIAFLLFLIDGARRFHKRTVGAVHKAQKGIAKEYADCAEQIEWLTLILGRGDSLFFLLDKDNAQPFSKLDIQMYESGVRNTLDRFGPDWAVGHFTDFPAAIPDSLSDQQRRIGMHRSRLLALIQARRGHRLAIADKAAWQRQTIESGNIDEVLARLNH